MSKFGTGTQMLCDCCGLTMFIQSMSGTLELPQGKQCARRTLARDTPYKWPQHIINMFLQCNSEIQCSRAELHLSTGHAQWAQCVQRAPTMRRTRPKHTQKSFAEAPAVTSSSHFFVFVKSSTGRGCGTSPTRPWTVCWLWAGTQNPCQDLLQPPNVTYLHKFLGMD